MNKININLSENTISKSEISLLTRWLKKNEKLTKGKLTIKFEKIFSSWLKNKYSIFVNSGSSANLLVAQSLLESSCLKNKTLGGLPKTHIVVNIPCESQRSLK